MQKVNATKSRGLAMLLTMVMVFSLAPAMNVFADGIHVNKVESQKVTVDGKDFYYVTYGAVGTAEDIEIQFGTAVEATKIPGTNIYYAGDNIEPDPYYYGSANIEYPDYWKNEGLTSPTTANWTASSSKTDSEGFKDMGGFDTVSRATSKHGTYRAPFQFITNVYGHISGSDTVEKFVSEHDPNITAAGGHSATTRAITSVPANEIASCKDGAKAFTVDGQEYVYDKYEIKGIQRVPVKISGNTYVSNLILKKENKTYIDKLDDFRLGGQDGSNRVVDAATGNIKELLSTGEYGPVTTGKSTNGRKVVVEDTVKDASGAERITTLNYNHAFGEYVTAEVGLRNEEETTMTTEEMLLYVTKFTSATYEYFGSDATLKTLKARYGTMGSTDTWWSTNHGARIDAGFQFDSYRLGSPDGQTKNKQFGYWRVTFRSAGYKDVVSEFYLGPEVGYDKDAVSMKKGSIQNLSATIKTPKSAIKSPAKYSSSNDKVVKIDEETGTATAIAAGTATITCDVNEGVTGDWHESASIKVTVTEDPKPVPPPVNNDKVLGEDAVPQKSAPKSFKVTAQKKKAKLTWKKSGGITKYQVAYKQKGKKKWSYKTVSAKSKSVIVKKLKAKKKYQFKIRSYKITSGKKVYSKWSKTKTIKIK